MQNLNPLLMNNYLDPFGIGCMKPKINYVRTYKGVIYTKKIDYRINYIYGP